MLYKELLELSGIERINVAGSGCLGVENARVYIVIGLLEGLKSNEGSRLVEKDRLGVARAIF